MTNPKGVMAPSKVRNFSLAGKGKERVDWAIERMPVLQEIRRRFARQKPLKGHSVAACLHVTSETAHLALVLRDAGARVTLCASNPLSTQDDVAAYLAKDEGIGVYAIHGIDGKGYYEHINGALSINPSITMDDGADTVTLIHTKRRDLLKGMVGGTEETTTGVIRLRAMAKQGKLAYPVIAVNDSMTKYMFDNRYGTGQSTIDGIIRATNVLLAGRSVVIAGYGWCGRGVAMRARGLGANVIVTEVDPHKALEAQMDGYTVLPMALAAKIGSIFITLTGDCSVIRREHFLAMKDGAIVCNSGHFNVEIDIDALESLSKSKRIFREVITQYNLKNGKKVLLLGEGRLVNLAAAEGHPADVMDMSFANQALASEYLVKKAKSLKKQVYTVPLDIDRNIAALKMKSMGTQIDVLTPKQVKYLASWEFGT